MPPIPNAACRLLWMSETLTLGQKAIWQQMAAFPETGCFMTAANLGRRVGLAGEFAERTRRELRALGLARLGQRQPSEGRRGRPAQTWFATFPQHLVPESRTPTDDALVAMLPAFDGHLRSVSDGQVIPTEESGNNHRFSRPSERDNASPVARSASRGEGGRGEGSPHSHPVETTGTPPSLHTPSTDLRAAREARGATWNVRRAPLATLAGGETAEFDRTIEREVGGARPVPRDLQDRLTGWEQRMRGGQ